MQKDLEKGREGLTLDRFEAALRLSGGLLAYAALAIVFYGIWRGAGRPSGRTSGRAADWLRSAWFYLFSTVCFLGLSIIFWRRLPLILSPGMQLGSLILGSLLYISGLLLLLWARLTLGRMYFVSTSFGAQLYSDHYLVKSGPFALVRHPMYAGLILAALGSLLLYRTWTSLAYTVFAPFVFFRARREELALGEEFKEEWRAYCRDVPAFLPRIRREKVSDDKIKN